MQTRQPRIGSRALATALAAGALAALGAGCDEDTEDSARQATEEAGNKIESAIDEGGQSAEKARRKAEKALDEAEQQAEKLEQQAKEAAEDASNY